MTTKTKIALAAVKRKLERGSITEEQAKAEVFQITGIDVDGLLSIMAIEVVPEAPQMPVLPDSTGPKKNESEPEHSTGQVETPENDQESGEGQKDQPNSQTPENDPNFDRIDTVRMEEKKKAQEGKQ